MKHSGKTVSPAIIAEHNWWGTHSQGPKAVKMHRKNITNVNVTCSDICWQRSKLCSSRLFERVCWQVALLYNLSGMYSVSRDFVLNKSYQRSVTVTAWLMLFKEMCYFKLLGLVIFRVIISEIPWQLSHWHFLKTDCAQCRYAYYVKIVGMLSRVLSY